MAQQTPIKTCFDILEAGGIFSKFMFYVANYKNTDIPYLRIDERYAPSNMFDAVFEQPELDETFDVLHTEWLGPYTNENKIELSPNFERFKAAISKVKFNQEMQDLIDANIHLARDTAVHIRLTDMNAVHPWYGVKKDEDFLSLMETFDGDFFVASDNYDSISKMMSKFGDRVTHYEGAIRAHFGDDVPYKLHIDNFGNPVWWREAFLDMYLLSRAKRIVGRTSDVYNTAILYSGGGGEYVRV